MLDEQYYLFVDKTGHCFEDFQTSTKTTPDEFDKFFPESNDDGLQAYRAIIGAMLRAERPFGVGDMMAFRDDLTEAGFKWDVDFYVKKVDKN